MILAWRLEESENYEDLGFVLALGIDNFPLIIKTQKNLEDDENKATYLFSLFVGLWRKIWGFPWAFGKFFCKFRGPLH